VALNTITLTLTKNSTKYSLKLNFLNFSENFSGPINCPTGFDADFVS
jgi:hypothetical protein